MEQSGNTRRRGEGERIERARKPNRSAAAPPKMARNQHHAPKSPVSVSRLFGGEVQLSLHIKARRLRESTRSKRGVPHYLAKICNPEWPLESGCEFPA